MFVEFDLQTNDSIARTLAAGRQFFNGNKEQMQNSADETTHSHLAKWKFQDETFAE